MIIYAGQEITTNNWFTHIEPNDPRFYNIKTIEYTPKTIEDIESKYKITVKEYSEEWDAYYNSSTNEWLEDKCKDEECQYCSNRPDKPLHIDNNRTI